MAYVGNKLNRGDPGIFGSLWNIGKTVAGAVIPGAGTVLKVGARLTGGSRPPPKPSGRRFGPGITPPAVKRAAARAVPMRRAGVSMPHLQDGTTLQRDDTPVAGCPQGMHPNKSSYFNTSPGGTLIFHPPGTNCVKNRRRNPLNPRAFDRALGRVSSAKRFGERLSRVTIRSKCKKC